MTNLLVKSAVGPGSHCVNLLDEILCHGPNSLSLVAGGQRISFNAAVLCSLSPLLSTLVKQSTEDNCCSVHDDILVLLPQLRNWKTVKLLKTFLSSGMVGNISRVEMDELQNLLQMLGFPISCEVHPALIEDEEEQFFAEIKYEDEDASELLEKQDLFTRIQLERNDYEEIKNLIESKSSALIDREITDVGNIYQEMLQDEHPHFSHDSGVDAAVSSPAASPLPTPASIPSPDFHGFPYDRKRKRSLRSTIDAMEVVESAPLTSTHQDFECEQRSNSYSPCRSKTLPERPKRKLPNRKIKHSVFENTENEYPGGGTEKKNRRVAQKAAQYQCSKCNYKSKYKRNVKTHCEAVHKGVEYPCCKCAFKTTKLGDLICHAKTVHEGVRFPCSKCDYEAKKLKSLNRHVKSVHEGVKFLCTKCDYKATRRGNLKFHVKSVHEGVRFPCNECDFKGTHPGRLKKHIMAIHENRYACSKCDFKSTRKSCLVRHDKTVHE